MKSIYQWSILTDNYIDETITKQDESGKEIRVLEKVNKPITKNYFIAKPGISITQEAELYYESIVSECMKRGIMSQLQMRKRFLNDGGVLSEEQKKQYTDLWDKLFELKSQFNKLSEKPDENKDKLKILSDETTGILVELQGFEEKNGASIYDHTAETIARNRTALWLTLYLSYQQLDNNKNIPYFGIGKYEDRLNKYEEIERNEIPAEFDLIQKFLLVTTLWYFGKAEKQEDFDEILKIKEKKDEVSKEMDDKNLSNIDSETNLATEKIE